MSENGTPTQADDAHGAPGEAANAEARTTPDPTPTQTPLASEHGSEADGPVPAPTGAGADERGTAATDIIGGMGADDQLDPTLSDGRRDAEEATPTGPAPDPARPKLADVARVANGYARAKGSDATSFLRKHPVGIAVAGVVALVCVLALVMLGVEAADLPTDDLVRQAVRDSVAAPDSSGGFYGFDDPLALASVEVGARRRLASLPDGTAAPAGATAFASADVTLYYRNDHVSAVVTATLHLAKAGDTWGVVGEPAGPSVAYTARTGVSEQKALANVATLLDAAEEGGSADASEAGDDARSLADIYADGTFSVTSHDFDEDAQTDTLEVSCTASEGLATYACTLTVRLRFLAASGTWEIASASVSEGAKTSSLSGLDGRWTGTFRSQQSDGTKCLAANASPLELTVSDARMTGDGASLTVSLASALVHFHAYPTSDADACDGDTVLSDVRLTCTLSEEADDGSLTFVGALPDQAGGTCTLELAFGADGGATATLTTRHAYTEEFLLVFPYESTATYADAYALSQSD